MKRILFVELNEDGTVGGSHRIQHDLVTRLGPGYQPVVLHYQDNPWAGRLRERGVEVHTWDDLRRRESDALASGGRLSTAWTMTQVIARRRAFLRDQRIDLVHLNNSPFQGWDDWLPASRLAGVPCVVYAMGDAHPEPSALRRRFMRSFDVIFPLSRLVADSLRANSVPDARMVLTYPGLDLEEMASRPVRPRSDVRADLGIDDDRVLAVMVGNIRRWKGQHVVVEAVAALDPSVRDRLTVLLVGDVGPRHQGYADELTAAIGHAGIGDTVRFTGWRDDVPDLLEAADIALHASIMPEPFGLVVLEGLAHGCAVIAAGAGGPVEMLTPECGFLYEPERADELAAHLGRLVREPDLRLALGRQAREQARGFDLGRHVALIEGTYDALLA